MSSTPQPSRRVVFQGAFAGCALLALGACGAQTSTVTSGSPTAKGGSQALAKVSEIPVGGGVIFPDQMVVVTQPTKGQILGFSAACTHQGFTVTSVSGGEIHCDHHGSAFSIKNGAVENGPATQPLPTARVTVRDGSVYLA